jgi:hypothetical protein
MRIRTTLPVLITVLPCCLLVGCVAGTARIAPPTSSSTVAASVTGDAGDATTSPSAGDDTAPAVSAYDGGVTITNPYDAEDEPTPSGSPPDTAPSWWPASFVPGSLPAPANGRGNHAGSATCGTCHKAGGSASSLVWLMGGIVYADPGSTTPVPSAEIGIKSGSQFLHAYSASNGYFWLPPGLGPIDWTTAEIRIRTAQGELEMSSPAGSGDCQSCHTAGNRIHPVP